MYTCRHTPSTSLMISTYIPGGLRPRGLRYIHHVCCLLGLNTAEQTNDCISARFHAGTGLKLMLHAALEPGDASLQFAAANAAVMYMASWP